MKKRKNSILKRNPNQKKKSKKKCKKKHQRYKQKNEKINRFYD